jgi:hypothetical protein
MADVGETDDGSTPIDDSACHFQRIAIMARMIKKYFTCMPRSKSENKPWMR